MRIKMRTAYAGERGTAQPGHIIDLPDEEAKGLVAGGYAVAEVGTIVESAILSAPETAVALAQERPRGRRG